MTGAHHGTIICVRDNDAPFQSFLYLYVVCSLFSLFYHYSDFHGSTISIAFSQLSSERHISTHSTRVSHSIRITHLPKTEPTRISRIITPQIVTHPPFPTRTTPPIIPVQTQTPHTPSSHSSQKSIFIVFAVLGGVLVSGLLLGLVRCCYQYKKAPGRDRIAEVLNRHNLQREMEEIERNLQILGRLSPREPAPPYDPAPPSYEIITSIPPSSEIITSTPSSSPSPQPIPPRPAG
jgi:hypothetical protein